MGGNEGTRLELNTNVLSSSQTRCILVDHKLGCCARAVSSASFRHVVYCTRIPSIRVRGEVHGPIILERVSVVHSLGAGIRPWPPVIGLPRHLRLLILNTVFRMPSDFLPLSVCKPVFPPWGGTRLSQRMPCPNSWYWESHQLLIVGWFS